MSFKEWFDKKLVVSRFPMPGEIKKSDAKFVINVSCDYISSCQKVCMDNDIRYFWFPMDEVGGDIGLNSVFGALQILWIAEQENAKVILHCHAGGNRSVSVSEAYYFMRTKSHLERESKGEDNEMFKEMFIGSKLSDFEPKNMLLRNIRLKHLPSLDKVETFLIESEKFFLEQDWENDFKTESGLNTVKINSGLL